MLGEPPSTVLNMDALERELAMGCAQELETWRLEQYGKLLGG